ncbi:MAG: Vps62-related protein [Acidobacteriota bacterium]
MSLKTELVTSFEPTNLWWDKGSGADDDIAFWRVSPPSGYFAVGDYAQGNYGQPSGACLVVASDDPNALARPTDFQQVWNDKGSDSDEDGSLWIPIAPAGYVTLGCIAQRGYDTPTRSDIRCVRSDLVTEGRFSQLIWADHGSGGDNDVSIYGIRKADGTGLGYFMAQGNYDPPQGTPYAPK